MKQVLGLWFPDGETHMVDMATGPDKRLVNGIATYQYKKLEMAMKYVPADRRRLAIDIGAHIGTWSMHLAKMFDMLQAFEPMAEQRECWHANVQAPNAIMRALALGERSDVMCMRSNPWSTGAAHIVTDTVETRSYVPDVVIEVEALDRFGFEAVDFIKIDVEGWELPVVKGARETIERCRPIMVVEQKGREIKTYAQAERDQAIAWLEQELGMVRLDHYSGDWIMGWPS